MLCNGSSTGFSDGTNININADFVYDENDFRVKDFEKVFYEETERSSMTKDRNKGINTITYNHLNLPVEIKWTNNKKINYLYTATGVKVQKTVTNGANIKTTDYLDGFQYNNDVLEFFPHPEGYVKATLLNPNNNKYAYNYVYNYTDHLGNVRVSYTKDPQTGKLKILDESHYYPFGLKHSEYAKYGLIEQNLEVVIAPVADNPFKYKYLGQERQDELGLNWDSFKWRNYDYAIGRFMSVDPLAEEFPDWSPYSYGFNNPLRFTDPTGMAPEDIIIRGNNNSSVTIKTDLVDISVNAGSVVGDLGGNYTLQGDDVLIAALDIVGIVDPTGVADIAAASLEAKNGNWGSALLSGMGVIPYVGDIGKVGKVGKHLKTIEKAIDGAKAVENTASTSRAARREVMRKEGIPTSQQPKSQSKNSSGREYSYDVPKKGGGTQTKSVQQQTKDRSHKGQPHWEAGKVKTDNGRTRMNNYNRPKLDNNKSKVNY